jgi:hypothetical protein
MPLDLTPNLLLPYLAAAQAQKHVTHNEALRALDALVHLTVLDRDLATPPTSPTDGARYIIATAPTGAWAGAGGKIAAWQDGAWAIYDPREGWLAWVADEDVLVAWTGTAWALATSGSGSVNPTPLVGVNATADTTNRLSVASPAALFNHAGAGHQLKINKAAVANTASVLFQTNFSGRAEMGLAGDDNYRFKVSTDGTTWRDALTIDAATGRVAFPSGGARELLTANRTYFVRTNGNDANNGLANSAAGAFRNIARGLAAALALDLNGFDCTIQIADGTYTESVLMASPQTGAGRIILSGNTTTPANVTISANGSGVRVRGAGSRLHVQGLKVAATGVGCFHAESGGTIDIIGTVEVGAASAGHHFIAIGNANILVNQTAYVPIRIAGSAAGFHLYATGQGYIFVQLTAWTVVSAVTLGGFAGAFNGEIFAYSNTFSNATNVTGARHNASLNGVINTNGGGASYFPGTSAGTTSTGGQFA